MTFVTKVMQFCNCVLDLAQFGEDNQRLLLKEHVF